MENTFSEDSGMKAASTKKLVLNSILAVILLYIFLVGVECLSKGVKGLGAGVMNQYLGDDLNPILALLAGILATTLVQSSSVTTALIVGLVASGEVAVATAVPMIMGANIGTTVTNTIASLAHATRATEFKRAFAAATCHDFFNFLSVLTLLPLELVTRAMTGTGILERISRWIATTTMDARGAKYKSPLKAAFKAGAGLVKDGIHTVTTDKKVASIMLGIVGCLIIFAALWAIVRVMRTLVLSKLERYLNRFLGSGGPIGILVGIVLTIMVQSSSITTSVLVPLAGAGLITITQTYPITLGANIGTTVTALLASMVVSGDAALAARQIALVHLLFNLMGILLWYVPTSTRMIPIRLATRMAEFATVSKRWAVAYVFAVFYILPAIIFFISESI
ncbi:MAG: Na/Pi symporter [Myxococcota bacterium]|nr:Na/Pi symporter [Myxococcota bacterium]